MSRSRSWSPSEELPQSSSNPQMCDSDFEDGESVVNDSDFLDELDDELNSDSAISSSTRSSDASISDQMVVIKKAAVGTVNKSVLKDEMPLSKTNESPLIPSLFPNVPPSMHFCGYDQMHEQEPRHGLKWQLTRLTPVVVRHIVANAGFELIPVQDADPNNNENDNESRDDGRWTGTWGLHLRKREFETLKSWQKTNHFPGGGNLARKDRIWRHHKHWRQLKGKESFGFFPNCFIWPQEADELRKYWRKKGPSAKWIIKPPAMARGQGISVVSKWRQIPPDRELVVQEYIARPHLVKSKKYDLRLYVLVTSLEPLRVYIHDEGLVRFASRPYDSEQLSDVFMHLTNFSVNRANEDYFVEGEEGGDLDEEERGFKWRLSTLWRHFQQELNIDHRPIWKEIKALVVKTLISVLRPMRKLWRSHVDSHYNCYELFGFDVLLDEDLRTWLLEVNLSPSLHSSSHLDLGVKGAVVSEMLNLVRFHPRDERIPKLYSRSLLSEEMEKQRFMLEMHADASFDVSLAILDALSPDDVRHLIRAEDELVLTVNFERIFPPVLDQNEREEDRELIDLMEPNYYDLLLHSWESKYGNRRYEGVERLKRLCGLGAHLQ